MSDERDSADAAGDGPDETGALTQPLRPTGKRSRQRAGNTALADVEDFDSAALSLDLEEAAIDDPKSKKALEKARKAGKVGKDGKVASTRNPFVFIATYLSQVSAELRKVIWPNRKEMVSYTTVVMVFLIFMVALIGLVDLGMAKLVLLVFGNK